MSVVFFKQIFLHGNEIAQGNISETTNTMALIKAILESPCEVLFNVTSLQLFTEKTPFLRQIFKVLPTFY